MVGVVSEHNQLFSALPGAKDLIGWFGRVPSFHDAEVLSIYLNRRAESHIRIHTWSMTNSIDEKGYFILDKHVVVTFSLQDISASKFEGLSRQNVIDGFELLRHQSAGDTSIDSWSNQFPPRTGDYGLVLDGGNGMGGFIYARSISLAFAPGKPADAKQ
jgi:hypothetical protein